MASLKPCFMGIGFVGMPHTDIARACRAVLASLPEAPALPSLQRLYPKLFAINGYRDSRGMPCLKVNEIRGKMYFDTSSPAVAEELTEFYRGYLAGDLARFGLRTESAWGQTAMLDLLRQRKPGWKLVQFSLYGPVTFGLDIPDEHGKPIFYNDTFRDAIMKSLTMLTRWYEARIKEAAGNISTLALLGEPSLQLYGSALVPIAKETIIACLNGIKAETESIICVHCCANTDWSVVMESKVDAISFDAYNYHENLILYAGKVEEFLARGGMLAWGIIPNTEPGIKNETADRLADKLDNAISALAEKGVNRGKIIEASFIQPCCNTVGVSPEVCEQILATVNAVSREMRRRHFPDGYFN